MLSIDQLMQSGLTESAAADLAGRVSTLQRDHDAVECWRRVTESVLTADLPFTVHQHVHTAVFADAPQAAGPAPCWVPDEKTVAASNINAVMRQLGMTYNTQFHPWSAAAREAFWRLAIERLHIQFKRAADDAVDPQSGVESPDWLPGASLNIVDSCFAAPDDATAIIAGGPDGSTSRMTIAELAAMTGRVANSLRAAGFSPGDAIAIDMPMTPAAVAIYLGIVAAGCTVIGIADSFAAPEIATRLHIADAKGIFTAACITRAGKQLPLYEKVIAAGAPRAIVLDHPRGDTPPLRAGDVAWQTFLGDDETLTTVARRPHDAMNILFSSGTTGDPKAIPWDHTTPIRSAADGHFHHDIHEGDVIAWPTSLGWMMGPWLIFAALINRAAIALYSDVPTDRNFGRFVERADVTMLGLVPSLVRVWRQTACMEGLDWSGVRAFSSTGECSNAADMHYLMHLAGYRPIIEYCGGTEIGGGYITGTVVQPNIPSTFSTPALGLDVAITDDEGQPADTGELFIVPPSIGLSRTLLNRDHHEVYFADTPTGPGGQTLRRHGDAMTRLPAGYFRALGRADDTMNLGGIKVSSAEIERAVAGVEHVKESAAIAVNPHGGGPSQLVMYVVLQDGGATTADELQPQLQAAVRTNLNPLFRVADTVIIEALPRTASQKVMRLTLRAEYQAS